MQKPILGLTLGDPCGVGPEIVVKALSRPQVHEVCVPYVIGHRAVVEDAARIVGAGATIFHADPSGLDGGEAPAPGRVGVIEPPEPYGGRVGEYGQVSAAAGEAAFAYVRHAVDLAAKGFLAGIVTAPLHKEALNRAGYAYSGHTEILADLTHTESPVMMLVVRTMRVAHVTTHVALKEVPQKISAARIVRVITLFDQALRDLGIARPKIAVAGLNPHSGEGGLFGDEEIVHIVPAVREAQSKGFDVTGPLPGDTVFVLQRAGRFDGVVAMYHDQGHIPVKLLGFEFDPAAGGGGAVRGVNVTLGLPVVRTSVDHGTAFDIAGKGIANEESMVDAILLGASLAGLQRPHG